ncbi:hypothetical protein [Nostoc sp. PA-18-2419]|uniref:hypothetical protein n=1 Tax=Nostoc sp. PA-18-2419 TaxID=2575443 RepID=UPI0016752672|nr:hypothetical protein [Nostoc sp. PA-18-2419]
MIANYGESIIVAHPDFEDTLQAIAKSKNLRFLLSSQKLPSNIGKLPEVDIARRPLIF